MATTSDALISDICNNLEVLVRSGKSFDEEDYIKVNKKAEKSLRLLATKAQLARLQPSRTAGKLRSEGKATTPAHAKRRHKDFHGTRKNEPNSRAVVDNGVSRQSLTRITKTITQDVHADNQQNRTKHQGTSKEGSRSPRSIVSVVKEKEKSSLTGRHGKKKKKHSKEEFAKKGKDRHTRSDGHKQKGPLPKEIKALSLEEHLKAVARESRQSSGLSQRANAADGTARSFLYQLDENAPVILRKESAKDQLAKVKISVVSPVTQFVPRNIKLKPGDSVTSVGDAVCADITEADHSVTDVALGSTAERSRTASISKTASTVKTDHTDNGSKKKIIFGDLKSLSIGASASEKFDNVPEDGEIHDGSATSDDDSAAHEETEGELPNSDNDNDDDDVQRTPRSSRKKKKKHKRAKSNDWHKRKESLTPTAKKIRKVASPIPSKPHVNLSLSPSSQRSWTPQNTRSQRNSHNRSSRSWSRISSPDRKRRLRVQNCEHSDNFYNRRRSRSRSRTRSPSRRHKAHSRRVGQSVRYHSRSRTRSASHSPLPPRSVRPFRISKPLRYHSRSRSRSRSRSLKHDRKGSHQESPDKMIDRKKLYEIARRNVTAMLQFGTLQQIRSMNADEIAKLKAGGQSVDELVEYCKKLQKKDEAKEKTADGEDAGSAKSDTESVDDDVMLRHPFLVKQQPIILNIRNATQLPVKTPLERAQEETRLRINFPVSSGQQHRVKEWVPVEEPKTAIVEPEVKMDSVVASGLALDLELEKASQAPLPPPPPPPELPPVTLEESVFAKSSFITTPVDISDVVSNRLKAIRRLQENANDVEALKLLHNSEELLRNWAESKNIPGTFTGSTGVQILTPDELGPTNPRSQAWARRDAHTNSKPLDGGMGMHMLRKMGWQPGEGLGKNKGGSVQPLLLDIKSDRRGLVALEELPAGRKLPPSVPLYKDLQGKHPVSALMELCSKRRWAPPNFTCVETGPSNMRQFLWKVMVNGVEYQPATTCGNKKLAKTQCATVVLQSLGLIPRDTSLPVVIG